MAHKTTELRNPKSSLNQNFLCPRGPVGIFLMHNLPLWHFPGPSPRPGANHQSCLSMNIANMPISPQISSQLQSQSNTSSLCSLCPSQGQAGGYFSYFRAFSNLAEGIDSHSSDTPIIGTISSMCKKYKD